MDGSSTEEMQERIRRLDGRFRLLSAYAAGSTLLMLVLLLGAFASARRGGGTPDVLRARGLIIEDAAGRERILLGAPIPAAAHRVRDDTAKVRAAWGARFPRQYLEWYRGYRHAVNGMLIIDERGFDRVALGDSVPDPVVGRRIGPEAGLIINNAEGMERTGYGVLDVNGRERVSLGLDARGGEALLLTAQDSVGVGVAVREGDRVVYLGTAAAGHWATRLAEPFHGLIVRRGDEVAHEVNAARRPR